MTEPKRGEPKPANPHPCSSCPWRNENHGKPHKAGWYTKKNRHRLWVGLRRGERMSCHKTDPKNPVPKGTEPVAEGHDVYECTGGLILQQREVMRFQKLRDLKLYRAEHPNGMTRVGLISVVERSMVGGTLFDPVEMTRPDLSQDVSLDGEKFEP